MTDVSPFDEGLEDFLRCSSAAPLPVGATLADQRAAYASASRRFDTPRPAGLTTEDMTLEGPAGPVPVRLYRPRSGRLPAIVYFHGGGFVFGDCDSHDSITADIAAAADAVVVSVNYRLAPEHRFPAAFNDCLAATLDLVKHADCLGLDARRLVVAGDSSGGNLAAAVAIAVRDSDGPVLRGQVLIYPMLGLDFETESCLKNQDAPMLKLAAAVSLAKLYLPGGFEDADWRAAPSRATDHSRLPPAFISVAEHDPLRDDGIRYARQLLESGVPCALSRAPGLVHSWLRARGVSKAAAFEFRRIVAEFRTLLA